MKPERLTWHLDNWAAWVSAKVDVGDYPSRSGSGIGRSGGRDFDAMVAESDVVCARAVDAILDGMEGRLRHTVYNCVLATVWPISGDPDENYAAALVIIEAGLWKRGIP